MTSRPFLSVRDLSYNALNGALLLSDVSFDMDEGAVLAIAGPNGAGKTTLLNLLSGIEDLATGDVWIDGQSLRHLSPQKCARKIAVVSQQEVPDARLEVRDYVALGQIPIWADRSTKDHTEALDVILGLTDLTALAENRIEQLSGGERQRAHIARALARAQSFFFLEEPTIHLDPDAKGRWFSFVTELGITVVMIVHDLVMIPEFATHVALMKSAHLTAFGPVNDVLTPERVRDTFGVDYLRLQHEGRVIPALDIRKIHTSN